MEGEKRKVNERKFMRITHTQSHTHITSWLCFFFIFWVIHPSFVCVYVCVCVCVCVCVRVICKKGKKRPCLSCAISPPPPSKDELWYSLCVCVQ